MTGLPDSHFEELIHPHTGAVGHVRTPARGFSSDFAAVVEGEKGRFFVKAMFNVPGGRKDSLLREQAINPFVQPLSPSLVWSAGGDEDGWIILGFEVIEGRASRFEKGSSDLSAVVETLDRIAGLGLPEAAKGWSEDRWDGFATSASEAALFRGNTLVHSDINPSNIIIGERGTWVVDWSWPTRGAAFIDPGCLVVQLIAAGHTPESAEGWASRCSAWTSADPRAIDAFALASLRMHRYFSGRDPHVPWLTAMAESAEAWVERRRRPDA
ncbi:protein kinase [Streptomyces sp. NPDC047071]|uniref:protein kinase n=1 Tax=Streptomyces sp. NPDC047071 TaxID=3154808 RepID=UPI0034531392